jgi:hypothetical protein
MALSFQREVDQIEMRIRTLRDHLRLSVGDETTRRTLAV